MVIYRPIAEAGIEPGLYFNLPYKKYDALKALRRSDVKLIESRSPMKVWGRTPINPDYVAAQDKDRSVESPECFGSAFHCFLLEQERYKEDYFVFPGDPYSKEKTRVSRDDDEQMKQQAMVIRALENSEHYLQDGASEVTILWPHARTLLMQKTRHDYFLARDSWDLKAVASVVEQALRSSISRYHYHIQAAISIDARIRIRHLIQSGKAAVYGADTPELKKLTEDFLSSREDNFFFYMQEKDYPYPVIPVVLSDLDHQDGMDDWNKAVEMFAAWQKKYGENIWPPCDGAFKVLSRRYGFERE